MADLRAIVVEVKREALPKDLQNKIQRVLEGAPQGYSLSYSWTLGERKGYIVRFPGVDSRFIIVTEGIVTSLIPDTKNLHKAIDEHSYKIGLDL